MGASLDCEQIKVNGKICKPQAGIEPTTPCKATFMNKFYEQLCLCLSMFLKFKARQLFCANYSRALKLLDPTL